MAARDSDRLGEKRRQAAGSAASGPTTAGSATAGPSTAGGGRGRSAEILGFSYF